MMDESQFRRRRHRMLTSAPVAPSDIFSSYTWTLAYDSKDLSGTSWPASSMSTASTLPTLAANSAPTENVGTGALLAAGLGASRIDRAVVMAPSTGGFATADTLSTDSAFTLPAGPMHIRALVRKPSDVLANGYLFRWLDTSAIFVDLYHISSERVTARVKDGTPDFTVNGTALPSAATWSLVDVLIEPTGGAGGFTKVTIWTNGTEVTATDTEVVDPFGNTGGFSIGGNGKSADISRGEIVFVGLRFGATLSLAEHQADLAAIGL